MSLTHLIAALPEPLFSRYELTKVLGVGAYAVVYQVKDKSTQEDFAMKVVEKEPMRIRGMLPQLQREVAIVADHADTPHIVKLLEIVETPVHFFLRFDLCKSSLEDICKAQGPIAEKAAFLWLKQACLGIKNLHENGIIHRDLKPSNLLVDADGSLSICDFGFACREIDNCHGKAGTPGYSPPETDQDGLIHTDKVDIYALGACLLHLLLGRCSEGPHDLPNDLSPMTQELLEEMMSSDPDDRPSIDDLLAAPQLSGTLFTKFLHVVLQGFAGH